MSRGSDVDSFGPVVVVIVAVIAPLLAAVAAVALIRAAMRRTFDRRPGREG